jgi:hypothetical protein
MLHNRVPVSIDGIRLDCFEAGREYEVGNLTAAVLLAEGWAEPLPFDAPALPVVSEEPIKIERRPKSDSATPANLIREMWPPSLDQAIAADLRRRRLSRPRK